MYGGRLGSRLKGKAALVTGGGSGIGEATCLLLADEGARVAVADLDGDRASAVAAGIAESGGQAVAVQGDVASDDGAAAIVLKAVDGLGSVDVLVCSAGLGHNRPLFDVTDDFAEMILSVNLKGTLFMAKHAARAMIESGGGSIITIASATATRPRPEMPVYVASKGAVVSLTRSLAIDLARHGIRANCVCPGSTATPMLNRHYARVEGGDELRRRNIEAIPLDREGQPSDIARAVLFLASDESSYVTGQILGVDGGTTAGVRIY